MDEPDPWAGQGASAKVSGRRPATCCSTWTRIPRAPLRHVERLEWLFHQSPGPRRHQRSGTVSTTGTGSASPAARIYDYTLAPFTQLMTQLRITGGRRSSMAPTSRSGATALDSIGGFDTSIEFHGEDTNLGRRLVGFEAGWRLDFVAGSIYTSAQAIQGFRTRATPSGSTSATSAPKPSSTGPVERRPRGHQALTCRAMSHISCATSTHTRPGATAGLSIRELV